MKKIVIGFAAILTVSGAGAAQIASTDYVARAVADKADASTVSIISETVDTITTTLTDNDTVAKANTAVQALDNVSVLANDAGYLTQDTLLELGVATSDELAGINTTLQGLGTASTANVGDFDAAGSAAAVQGNLDSLNSSLTTNDTVAKANAALPTPPTYCVGSGAQCVLAVNPSTGVIYWEDVAQPDQVR